MPSAKAKVNLFGSGAILRHVLLAQELLADEVPDRIERLERHQLHRSCAATPTAASAGTCCIPTEPPRQSYVEQTLAGEEGLFVAASDYVRALPEQISRWVPGELYALGTDGMGRSETRETLRRHFEVDAECIALATLYRLHKRGVFDAGVRRPGDQGPGRESGKGRSVLCVESVSGQWSVSASLAHSEPLNT